ncbi:restriction endonuclease subunit S [Thomasclavelia ramosa]|uniref:restriction endonuclease subunit S n=2 Tax=Bacillati TaxID=1783272 RepID=UPI001D07F705|nr:restriction endonuclease subunit S [Thomasclavelia ramosa]MCB6435871.1 restriction endonuclease subunit S [Thomasclavelia ramosa]MCB6458920.1 restriction endonuclease subunit S [Thomasclavelia ramosa]MCB6597100.1 restriction endonuclease subunit S [Thomasclavelia ramosa]MCB6600641.1 restriction endonuclease subunit S [Thomasclavelia ramosa]MCB6618680.1 restriction endonuclease subunit S [Thomasclavelia ramosa]
MSIKWVKAPLNEYIEVNPKEEIKKNSIAKKVTMDKLQPFYRDILEYELNKYTGGTKFRNCDTIMARITPCLENGKTAKVNILDENEVGFGSTEFIVFRAKNGLTTSDFVYYLVCSPIVREYAIKSMVGSSGRQRVQTNVIQDLEINFPSLPEQFKIANVLKLLDDKIALNNKINNNLLEQALTLYASQFAELDKNGSIGDYCSVKSGFAFKSSWWTNSGIKVIKIASINQDNLNLLECSYVDEDKINKAKDFKVVAGDLLIAMTGATIGKFAMVPYSSETLLVNQRVGKFFLGSNPIKRLPFIYCTLKQPDVYYEVVNRGQGSAQPNISASDIMSIPCVIPSNEILSAFNDTVQPLFDLIISNQQENQHLSELRDSLLPKLMSGELDISNVDL